MKSKSIRWLVVVNLFVLSLYITRTAYLNHQRYKARHEMLALGKSLAVRSGDTTSAEYDRWVDVADSVQRTRHISDVDLDWIISVARQTLSDTSLKAINRRGKFIRLLRGVKPWSPPQQEKAYQLCLALLGTGTYSDQEMAVDLFFYTRDRRAVPCLLPLQNSRDKNVREGVAMTLKRLGYTHTAGS